MIRNRSIDCNLFSVDVVVVNEESQQSASFIKSKSRQAKLPLHLTFFNFDTKVKFSVILAASMNPDRLEFSLMAFEALYGQVDAEAVQAAVSENSDNLRKIVAALNGMAK